MEPWGADRRRWHSRCPEGLSLWKVSFHSVTRHPVIPSEPGLQVALSPVCGEVCHLSSSLPGEGGLEERGLSVLFSGIGDSSVLRLDGLKVTLDNGRCWKILALGSLLEVSGILCVETGVSH